MMKKITLVLILLVATLGYSQTLPLDFEESDDANIFASVDDGGTFNIIADADNSGEFVGEFSGKVGGALYDHINVPLTTSLDIAATNTISFRVKQTTTEGTTSHLFKLQKGAGGSGADKQVAFETEYDVWKDVSLTYSGTGSHNELIIFFDFNSATVSGTYLIDDIVASSGQTENPSENSVTVATSQAWSGYMNVFNLDDSYAFGFDYPAADLRATATTTSMTLEPNIAIWTAEAANAGWFDQSAASQTANKYIEASSFIQDNTLAGSDLTFSGNISVADLGEGYTVVAFVKALDPNNGYATVVNNNADISSTGDFTASATAAELVAGYTIQYGFTVTGPLGDPDDTTLGSVVIGEEAPAPSENSVTVATSQAWSGYMNVFNLDDSYAFGFDYPAADLRATATATSMTLEPNIAIWTAEAANAGWFDQSAASQTANKYIEASSFIQDNTLAGSDLTFSGNISVADLGEGYTVVAFVKALDPNNGYATVVNNNADISSTGDFTASATAAELVAGYIIQYGFTVTGPLGDPDDTTLGSVVIGEEAPAPVSDYCEKVVAHLGIASGQEASEIKLTVVNSTEKSMKVTIESNNEDAVDLMLIPGDVTGSPTQSAVDSSVAGKMSITLTWEETAPTDVALNILWSKVSSGGNWQLGEAPTTFKFDATCATASIDDKLLVSFSMYPNPASSSLNISATSMIKNAVIYNILGKQVMNLSINKNSEAINVSNLASGMYLIKYTTEIAVGTAKFIKK
jgi:hypothetical protein